MWPSSSRGSEMGLDPFLPKRCAINSHLVEATGKGERHGCLRRQIEVRVIVGQPETDDVRRSDFGVDPKLQRRSIERGDEMRVDVRWKRQVRTSTFLRRAY